MNDLQSTRKGHPPNGPSKSHHHRIKQRLVSLGHWIIHILIYSAMPDDAVPYPSASSSRSEKTLTTDAFPPPTGDDSRIGIVEDEEPPNLDAIQLVGTEDPRYWSKSTKWALVGIISLMGFISPLGSSIVIPGGRGIDMYFHLGSSQLALLPLSFFVLGLGAGPFCLAPASELYGRRVVYMVTGVVFVLFNVGSSLVNNFVGLCVIRFFAGVFGSTGPSLGAGVIGDMFVPRERGRAQALYGLGPLLGPVAGNIIGSWIAQIGDSYWRWCLWALTIMSGIIAAIVCLGFKETYAPTLLKAKRRRVAAEYAARHPEPPTEVVETAKIGFSAKLHLVKPGPEAKTKLKQAFSRPFRLLFRNPICAIFSIYLGFCYGIIFLFLVQHPLLYGRRGPGDPSPDTLPTFDWSPGMAGLTYLGLGLGFLVAACMNAFGQDVIYGRLVASQGHVGKYLFKHAAEIDDMMSRRNSAVSQGSDIEHGDDAIVAIAPTTPAPVTASTAGPILSSDKEEKSIPMGPVTDDAICPKDTVTVPAAKAEKSATPSPSKLAPIDEKEGSDDVKRTQTPPSAATVAPTPAPLLLAQRKGEPEYRLPLCLLGMFVLPVGLFLFGWAAQTRVHWVVPLFGSFLVGAGTILCFQSILVYLVDAFIPYSASATACAVLVRSILAAVFPLFAEDLYASLGYGWGSSLLAFVALAGVPAPVILFRYGSHLRNKYKFQG